MEMNFIRIVRCNTYEVKDRSFEMAKCPKEKIILGGSENKEGSVRLKHKSWRHNYLLVSETGCEIKAEIRLKKRLWYTLWLVKRLKWSKWNAKNLYLVGHFYDGSTKLIDTDERRATNTHKLKINKWRAGMTWVSGNPVPEAHGVKSFASGTVESWLFIAQYWSDDVSKGTGGEKVSEATADRSCTGAGQQPA